MLTDKRQGKEPVSVDRVDDIKTKIEAIPRKNPVSILYHNDLLPEGYVTTRNKRAGGGGLD